MNRHFLAGLDAALALCALLGIIPAAVLAARARKPLTAILTVAIALALAAGLANSAADLW